MVVHSSSNKIVPISVALNSIQIPEAEPSGGVKRSVDRFEAASLPGSLSDVSSKPSSAQKLSEVADRLGVCNLLAGLATDSFSPPVRNHIFQLQERLNGRAQELSTFEFVPAPKNQQLDPDAGYSEKMILNAKSGTRVVSSWLHKYAKADAGLHNEEAVAAMIESTSIVANLLGMPTTLALRHRVDNVDGEENFAVSLKLIPQVEVMHGSNWDVVKADTEVIEYMLVSRWVDDVLGNLDAWAGQWLVPTVEARYQDILKIDLDQSFRRFNAEKLYDALVNHFGLPAEDISIEDCQWRDRTFEFDAPIEFDPEHLDSNYTVYGPLFRAIANQKVDFSIERLNTHLDRVEALLHEARPVLVNALSAMSAAAHDGMVDLPAANVSKISFKDFETQLLGRIEESIPQFRNLLKRLKEARGVEKSSMRDTLNNLPKRAY